MEWKASPILVKEYDLARKLLQENRGWFDYRSGKNANRVSHHQSNGKK